MKVVKSHLITCPHGFSTRKGGYSTGIYESLNLGMSLGDDKENVIANWNTFLQAVGITQNEFVSGKQIHGNEVCIVTKKEMRVAYGAGDILECDGFVTNEVNVPLVIFTADCLPLLLFDPVNRVIGAIHCGWRSTVADIVGNAINAMKQLNANEDSIVASIGPGICEMCFETGKDVTSAIDALFEKSANMDRYYVPRIGHENKYLVSLYNVLFDRLKQLGIRESNIERVGGCTMCQPDLYWSHRYTNGIRGSQANVIMLN